MHKLVLIIGAIIPIHSFCQAPDTDIWLMRITEEQGTIRLDHPGNITNRKGYDNQPAFSADGKTIYFTSQRDTAGQTDIYTYTIATRETKQFTHTATSEYSATTSQGGTGISVVMVEEDGAQRVWGFPFSGAKPSCLFPAADSVGYYAWVSDTTALAFILSDEKTNAERLALIGKSGSERFVADNIGRGMKTYGNQALFVKRVDSLNYLYLTDYLTVKQLVRTPGNSEDLALYKNYVIMADGSTLYVAQLEIKDRMVTGVKDFVPLRDLSSAGLHKITRIAISPDGKMMAITASME